jgi:hypothetical protein
MPCLVVDERARHCMTQFVERKVALNIRHLPLPVESNAENVQRSATLNPHPSPTGKRECLSTASIIRHRC